MKGHINFEQLLNGYYKRGRRFDPMAGYYASLGATVRSNDFADRNLNITEDMSVISIFFSILFTARKLRDFTSLEITDFFLPFSMMDINIIEQICLCEISINSGIMKIDLIDKIIYEKEINPLKSRMKTSPDYLSPDQLIDLAHKIVPHPPSTDEIIDILLDNKIYPMSILYEIEIATNYEYKP